MHLDNGLLAFARGKDALPSLTGLCMHLFRDVAFFGTCARVAAGTLALLRDEREGGDVDRECIKNCVQVFQVVGGCEREACMALAR
jgi:hypothetical protein